MVPRRLIKLAQFLLLTALVSLTAFYLTKTYMPCVECQTGPGLIQFSFLPLTLAALADSVNPCAIAVLMILLEGLIMIRKNILTVGFSFIFGIFLAYLLIGLGLLSGLTLFDDTTLFHQIVAIVAIIVGVLNIKDYFFYGKFLKMEIPDSWRPRLGQTIQKATTPIVAFLIGLVVSLFELPCTGGPYLFALGLLKGQAIDLTLILSLIYYNLVFVLPLILIILAVYYSYVRIELTEEWRKKNIKLLHLISGIILLALGTWLISIS